MKSFLDHHDLPRKKTTTTNTPLRCEERVVFLSSLVAASWNMIIIYLKEIDASIISGTILPLLLENTAARLNP
jgi:mannose/fructose-specific phosphotransferase system component IIA